MASAIYLDSNPTPTSNYPNHLTVYTISKALGMGGLRLGWCFINDEDLTKEIKRALFVIGICPSSFGMEAAVYIFHRFLSDPNILDNYINNMGISIKNRLSLISMLLLTGPYAWIKAHDDNIDIAEYLIKVNSGVQFGSTANYARLSLISDSEDFNTQTLVVI